MPNTTVCLLNDSFPPIIDGVANVVMNYAANLPQWGYDPVVITPAHPEADDANLPYPVIRYASMDMRAKTGYMAGIPFSAEVAKKLEGKEIGVIHTHCPIVSTMIARELRSIKKAPVVLTYHTKFDIDIANIIKSRVLQETAKRALVENINACDEVWAVSRGAVENLRELGYEGSCVVMENGVDLPRGAVAQEKVQEVTGGYDLPENVPVYLFVGRMMWYKGLRLILDALAKRMASGGDFRMVFVGGGGDMEEVQAYSDSLGLQGKCIFAGPERDRERLRAWYSRGDLFLFPSTFDTNGLVVREAAACGLGAVLVEGSCAAEGVTNGRNGLLIQENAQSLFACLQTMGDNRAAMARIGENAQAELYISWAEAVEKAQQRYAVVMDNYRRGITGAVRQPEEELFRANGEMMETMAKLQSSWDMMTLRQRERLQDFREVVLERKDRLEDLHQRAVQKKETLQDKLSQRMEQLEEEIRGKREE